MLKIFIPLEAVDGVNKQYRLPPDYSGGILNVFINGALTPSLDEFSHPLGYFVNSTEYYFEFYNPLYEDDYLYIIYDSLTEFIYYENICWHKNIKKINFSLKPRKIDIDYRIIKIKVDTRR